MLEVQVLEERLEEQMLGCQRYRAVGKVGKEYKGYSIWECYKEWADIIRDKVKRIKGLIKWERFLCCFKYRIPQGIYERFEINLSNSGWRKRRGGIYQFKGVLVKLLMLNWIMWWVKFRVQVEGKIKEDGLEWVDQSNIKIVIRWIGKKIRQGGLESNRMCWMFCEFLEYRESYIQSIIRRQAMLIAYDLILIY